MTTDTKTIQRKNQIDRPTKRANVTLPHFTESHHTKRIRETNRKIVRSLKKYR